MNQRKANISIVDNSGQTDVATSTFGNSAGWVNFAASGFTFSSPKIKVQIESKTPTVPQQPNPTGLLISKSGASKIVKLVCVKNKTKKVVSVGKCPVGYLPTK